MSEVWLAAMRGPAGFEKLVAVKQLRAVGEDRGSLLDEARLAARLNHPNIVQTFEVLSQGGDYRIVMEFLEGQPLNRVLSRALKLLPPPHWVRVLTDALAGLHHAHEATDRAGRPLHLVHRDVSPHNIFITWDGGVKLLDFGIAAFEQADRIERTEDGVIKGKLTYMAPEQAMAGAVDRRADLFSVGVILWEVLAGRRMWSKMADHLVYQELVQGQLPRLAEVAPEAPEALVRICERALAQAPDDRYPTADAMRRDLDAWLAEVGRPSPRELGDRMAALFADERQRVALLTALDDDEPVGPDEPTQLYSSDGSSSPGSLPRHTAPLRIDLGASVAGPPSPWPRILGVTLLSAPAVIALAMGLVVAVAPEMAPDWLLKREPEPEPAEAVGPGGCPLGERPQVELSGEIASDLTLVCSSDYRLVGTVRVKEGVTLGIAPGTVIRGDLATGGTLVVSPGARLIAEGTAEAPITFTSGAAAAPRPGDWGGIVILGRAPTNLAEPRIEGLADGDRFGGDQAHDDSGVLRHVRIGYAGLELGPNNETNGLTLGGVGRGTVIDHVLVWAPADDCFSFVGGTVDGAHLVCVDPGDDGFDLDAGYTGRLSSVVVADRRSGGGERNGIEVDNDPRGTRRRPVTDPRVEDATLCGAGGVPDRPGYGLLVRRGAQGSYEGLWVDGFSAGGAALDDTQPAVGPVALAPGIPLGEIQAPSTTGQRCPWPPVGGGALRPEARWDEGWIDWEHL